MGNIALLDDFNNKQIAAGEAGRKDHFSNKRNGRKTLADAVSK